MQIIAKPIWGLFQQSRFWQKEKMKMIYRANLVSMFAVALAVESVGIGMLAGVVKWQNLSFPS